MWWVKYVWPVGIYALLLGLRLLSNGKGEWLGIPVAQAFAAWTYIAAIYFLWIDQAGEKIYPIVNSRPLNSIIENSVLPCIARCVN